MGQATLATYSLESKTYKDLGVEGNNPSWLDDDRSLLFERSGSLFTLDLGSGRVHEVAVPGTGPAAGRASAVPISGWALTRDQRTLFLQRARNQADIWRMTLSAEAP